MKMGLPDNESGERKSHPHAFSNPNANGLGPDCIVPIQCRTVGHGFDKQMNACQVTGNGVTVTFGCQGL